MNTAMSTTISDLSSALRKSLASGELKQQMQIRADQLANDIVDANTATHPGLEARAVQTGPLSWSLSFTAPGLWNHTFGSSTGREAGFETRPSSGDESRQT